jgi:hypothetical protein
MLLLLLLLLQRLDYFSVWLQKPLITSFYSNHMKHISVLHGRQNVTVKDSLLLLLLRELLYINAYTPVMYASV